MKSRHTVLNEDHFLLWMNSRRIYLDMFFMLLSSVWLYLWTCEFGNSRGNSLGGKLHCQRNLYGVKQVYRRGTPRPNGSRGTVEHMHGKRIIAKHHFCQNKE